jgi:signal transduction histidine kinase
MTAGIVHDFRNILAVVGSGLRLAENHLAEPEKMRVFIAGAREGIERGLKLTAQLLTFAQQRKLEAGAGDANECLRNLAPFLSYGVGTGIRITWNLAPDLPKCLLDASQFSAAILNLVINARDAMPNGGDVQISTERWMVDAAASGSPAPGVYVRVRIEDNGEGMSPEAVRRVFDPFFTTKGESGTGLGLAQVSTFMQLIGGQVSVASERGVGTTVDLLLPSAEPTPGVPCGGSFSGVSAASEPGEAR